MVDRDSAVGSRKYTEKCRAVEESRKIIILLSNSYLGNPSCLAEADLIAGNYSTKRFYFLTSQLLRWLSVSVLMTIFIYLYSYCFSISLYIATKTKLLEPDFPSIKVLFILHYIFQGYQRIDGQECYQPNRILVLVMEELNEEVIKPPITSLLTENVINVVSLI